MEKPKIIYLKALFKKHKPDEFIPKDDFESSVGFSWDIKAGDEVVIQKFEVRSENRFFEFSLCKISSETNFRFERQSFGR